MNTTIRSTLSHATALGLVSFIITSAIVSSVAAPATLTAFGLLAVQGVLEIAIVSYQGPRRASPAAIKPEYAQMVSRPDNSIAFPADRCPLAARAA